MKNLFFLLLLPALIMSCGGGVEQYRAGVEELTTSWDSATASVTELQNNIATDLANISKEASTLNIPAEAMAKLKPEQATEWQTAQNNFTQALQGFAPIRTEIGEFTKAWSEESQKVQALKEGLEAGTLDATATTQINDLAALIPQAKERVAGWQAAYAEAKSKTETALGELKAKFDQLNAAMPVK